MLDRLWSIYVVIGCKFTQALDIKYQFILQLQFYSTYISISISYYFTVYFHFIIIYQLFCRLHTASQPKEHIFTLIYFYIYPRSLPYYRVAKWEELFCAKSHIDFSDKNVIRWRFTVGSAWSWRLRTQKGRRRHSQRIQVLRTTKQD